MLVRTPKMIHGIPARLALPKSATLGSDKWRFRTALAPGLTRDRGRFDDRIRVNPPLDRPRPPLRRRSLDPIDRAVRRISGLQPVRHLIEHVVEDRIGPIGHCRHAHGAYLPRVRPTLGSAEGTEMTIQIAESRPAFCRVIAWY